MIQALPRVLELNGPCVSADTRSVEVEARSELRAPASLQNTMLRQSSRLAAALRLSRSHSTASQGAGIIEVRKYTLIPDGMKAFLKLSGTYADLRRELIPGFLG